MNEVVTTYPTAAGDLGYRDVGRVVTVTTEDATARGELWSLEFRGGEAKVAVKSSNGLLFFNLKPDAIVHLGTS